LGSNGQPSEVNDDAITGIDDSEGHKDYHDVEVVMAATTTNATATTMDETGFEPLTQLECSDSASNSLIVDLPEPDLLTRQKHKVLGRFLDVLKLLLGVYSIPQTSVHIFADKEMRFVSFNRGRNIFLNLRLFEEGRTSCVSALL
jgi:hypothetical protein